MASTRISSIIGPEGPEGPVGPAGPTTMPTAEFIGTQLADPDSPAGVVLAAKIATAIDGRTVDPTDVGDDLILLIGQSNEFGYGVGIDTMLDLASPRVVQWPSSGTYLGKVIAGINPLYHYEQTANSVGNGPAFGREYVRTVPENRRALLVPCAVGSTGFSTSSLSPAPTGYTTIAGGGWDPSGDQGGINLYEKAIAQVLSALALNSSNRLSAVIWMQGEADSASMTGTAYAAKLDALITGLRTRIPGAADVPFLIGSMIPERIDSGGAVAAIASAHVETQRRLTRTGFFYGPRGMNLGDNLHYNADAQRRIGAILAPAALRRALKNVLGTDPIAPSVVSLTQSGTSLAVVIGRPEARFTDFNIRYRSDGGSWTTLTRAQSVDINATITGLTLGSTVDVQVRSVNEEDVSAWSASTAAVLATIPGQVTGLTAGTPVASAMPLTWTATSGATSYLVEYKTAAASTWTTGPTVSTNAANPTGLTPGTDYNFRVSAINAAGTGTVSATTTATTAVPSTIAADVGVAPARATGTHRLVAAYGTGPALAVRRSSDNAVVDIALLSSGELDTAALLAHCGSGSGYVPTWYDQSGNGRHRVQATAGLQPMIVNAGTLVTKNGKPAVTFDGVDDRIASTAPVLYAAGASTVLGVLEVDPTATAGATILSEGNSVTSNNARYVAAAWNTGGFLATSSITDANTLLNIGTATANPIPTGALSQFSVKDTGSNISSWMKGLVARAAAAYTRTAGALTVDVSTVGAVQGRGVAAQAFLKGSVCEIVEWTSALTDAQRIAGETNQKSYYSIT